MAFFSATPCGVIVAVMLALPYGGAAGSVGGDSRRVSAGRIEPTLEPPGDHGHFFKHDYPHDLQPIMEDKWSHPFPLVQDTKDYDKDFVKDENYDGGQWRLQSEYDRLRGRLASARLAKALAMQAANETGRKLDIANHLEGDARERVRAALEARREAERKAEAALRRAEAKYRAAEVDKLSSAASSQERAVGQDSRQLEDCRKELEQVRAHLRDLQDEKVKAEDQLRESTAEEEVAEARQLEKEQEEAALEEKADKATAQYNKAHARYEKKLAEEETTERKLQEAEVQLRHFRHPETKGFGLMASPSLWLISFLFALIPTSFSL